MSSLENRNDQLHVVGSSSKTQLEGVFLGVAPKTHPQEKEGVCERLDQACYLAVTL